MAFIFPRRRCLTLPLHTSALLLATLAASPVHAAPSGGSIAGGAGTITQTGSEITIVQDSPRLAIDWDGFNIASDERVQFIQPGQDAIALNRVLGNDASQIFGRLDANGHVLLVNPNGVIFGESATVDVGGLVASGLSIDTGEFMNGELSFTAEGSAGVVINSGLINAAVGGNVILLGQQVANDGVIRANLGSVALAAGKAAVLTFEANGLLGVRVTEAVEQSLLGDAPAVANAGEVDAGGGRVLLTASASADVFSQAVNSGDLAYQGEVLVHEDGSFTLGGGADVQTTGLINTSAPYSSSSAEEVASAGSVAIVGENVQLSGSIWASDSNEGSGPAYGADVVVVANNELTATQSSLDIGGEYRSLQQDRNEVILLGRRISVESFDVLSGNQLNVRIGGEGNGNGIEATAHVDVDETTRVTSWGDANLDIWASESAVIDGTFDLTSSGGGIVDVTSLGTLGLGGFITAYGYESTGSVTLQASSLSVTEFATATSIAEVALERILRSSDLTLRSESDIEFGTADRGVAIAARNSSFERRSFTMEAAGDLLMSNSYVRLEGYDASIDAGGCVVLDTTRLMAPDTSVTIRAAGAIDRLNSSLIDADSVALTPNADSLTLGTAVEVIAPPTPDMQAKMPPKGNPSTPAPTPVLAGLTGGKIVGGAGSITQAGNQTTIVQDSQRLAVNWDTFNIAADDRVEFVQPSSSAIALNRILSCDATQILGQLDANGHVVLVNPNGVFFGESATVEVGGLVASGLNIKPKDFLDGDLYFKAKGSGGATVINNGSITAATGGNVVLLGNRVVNDGEIMADYGNIALAAGRAAELTVEANELIATRVTDAVKKKTAQVGPAVSNSGEVLARHGRILLSASESQDVFSLASNSGSAANESTILVHGATDFILGEGAGVVNAGTIDVGREQNDDTFDAGHAVILGADILNSGRISADTGFLLKSGNLVLAASGQVRMEGEGSVIAGGWGASQGGTVALLGKEIHMVDSSVVDVGEQGHAIIGARGNSDNSLLGDTERVLLGENTTVYGGGRYDGGTISSWSSVASVFGGGMNVTASTSGAIELATEGSLGLSGSVALYSDGRNVDRPGSLLLRAPNLTVSAEKDDAHIYDESLNSALRWGRVTLEATDDILFGGSNLITALVGDASPSPVGNPRSDVRSLTLNAGGDVTFDNVFIYSPLLDLTVSAGGEVTYNDVRRRAGRNY